MSSPPHDDNLPVVLEWERSSEGRDTSEDNLVERQRAEFHRLNQRQHGQPQSQQVGGSRRRRPHSQGPSFSDIQRENADIVDLERLPSYRSNQTHSQRSRLLQHEPLDNYRDMERLPSYRSNEIRSQRSRPQREPNSSSSIGRHSRNADDNSRRSLLPPSYDDARLPTIPVTYTFSPTIPRGSMLLIPPSTHPDTRALYHISAHLNPFMPSSSVTTLTRGPTPEIGEEVGEFETGCGRARMPTVTIGGKQDLMDAILVDDEGDGERYVWRLPPFRPTLYLFWDYHVFPFECHLGGRNGAHLASFTPDRKFRSNTHSQRLATLQVLPMGFKRIDEIVLSLLAIEWWSVASQSIAYGGEM